MNQENCSICLEECKDNIVILPCTHKLHTECLNMYIQDKCRNGFTTYNCPVCITEYSIEKNLLEEQSKDDWEMNVNLCLKITYLIIIMVIYGLISYYIVLRLINIRSKTKNNILSTLGLALLMVLIFCRFMEYLRNITFRERENIPIHNLQVNYRAINI